MRELIGLIAFIPLLSSVALMLGAGRLIANSYRLLGVGSVGRGGAIDRCYGHRFFS